MFSAREQYEKLVSKYHVSLYRLLYGYCGNKQDAEDGVQIAFLRLWQSKKHFLSESHAKNWLYKVAVNYVKDLQKTKWNKVEELKDETPFTTKEAIDLYEEIYELSDDYRIAILLYYYEDYSIKEISKILDVKESTIATRLQRARTQLKFKLEEEYGR